MGESCGQQRCKRGMVWQVGEILGRKDLPQPNLTIVKGIEPTVNGMLGGLEEVSEMVW